MIAAGTVFFCCENKENKRNGSKAVIRVSDPRIRAEKEGGPGIFCPASMKKKIYVKKHLLYLFNNIPAECDDSVSIR